MANRHALESDPFFSSSCPPRASHNRDDCLYDIPGIPVSCFRVTVSKTFPCIMRDRTPMGCWPPGRPSGTPLCWPPPDRRPPGTAVTAHPQDLCQHADRGSRGEPERDPDRVPPAGSRRKGPASFWEIFLVRKFCARHLNLWQTWRRPSIGTWWLISSPSDTVISRWNCSRAKCVTARTLTRSTSITRRSRERRQRRRVTCSRRGPAHGLLRSAGSGTRSLLCRGCLRPRLHATCCHNIGSIVARATRAGHSGQSAPDGRSAQTDAAAATGIVCRSAARRTARARRVGWR